MFGAALVGSLGVGVAFLLFTYGTLSPCQMLRQDVVGHVAREILSASRSGGLEILETQLAVVVSRSQVDTFIATLSPWECAKFVYKIKFEQVPLPSFGRR